jgi:hypothetical protein
LSHTPNAKGLDKKKTEFKVLWSLHEKAAESALKLLTLSAAVSKTET